MSTTTITNTTKAMAQILLTNASNSPGKHLASGLAERGHTFTNTLAKKQVVLIICGETSVQETKDLVKEARKAKLRHIIFISALGASPRSRSRHLVTKYEEELIIRQSNIPYTIFRPGILLSKTGHSPRFPVPGFLARRIRPTYIEDLLKIVAAAVDAKPENTAHEMGGPELLTLRELLSLVKKAIKHQFSEFTIPFRW